jgi:hypothetical protein
MSPRRLLEPPPVVERLVPEAFAGTDHSPIISTFLRGLTTGALVGAAIAGSALWNRYRRSHRPQTESVTEAAPGTDTTG